MFTINRLSALRPISLLIAIAFLLALSFGAYAFATGNVISACARKDGSVYLVGTGFLWATCMRGDQPLTWNIQGPKGDKGDPGAPGKDGAILRLQVDLTLQAQLVVGSTGRQHKIDQTRLRRIVG